MPPGAASSRGARLAALGVAPLSDALWPDYGADLVGVRLAHELSRSACRGAQPIATASATCFYKGRALDWGADGSPAGRCAHHASEAQRPRDIKRRAARPERRASRGWNARAGRRSARYRAARDSGPALCRPLQSRVRGGAREVLGSLVPGRLAVNLGDGVDSVVVDQRWRRSSTRRPRRANSDRDARPSSQPGSCEGVWGVGRVEARGRPRVRSWRREAKIRTHQKD